VASIDSKLAVLRLKAAKNELEVEHLIEMAALGDVRAIPVIRELQAKHGWTRSNQPGAAHLVPLARWAEVVCAYLEGGCDALVTSARQPEPDSLYFALAVLQEVKSSAAALALAELAFDIEGSLSKRAADGLKLADAINLTLSFKNSPQVYPDTAKKLRTFLHALLARSLSEPEMARVVCALRGVGNEDSIRLIGSLPKFNGAWSGLETSACKAIRNRLARSSGKGRRGG
jgi:hypothetical protein